MELLRSCSFCSVLLLELVWLQKRRIDTVTVEVENLENCNHIQSYWKICNCFTGSIFFKIEENYNAITFLAFLIPL